MKKRFGLIALTMTAAMLAGLIACSSGTLGVLTEKSEAENIQANVGNPGKFSWKIEKTQLGQAENIETFYFYDADTAYGIAYGKFAFDLYRTTDGGKSWTKQSSMSDLGVNDVFFTTPLEGFLALSKLKPSSNPDENGSVVMKTEDGGATWKTVYSAPAAGFYKLNFDQENLGVLVGRKKVSPSSNYSGSILITEDRGKTWLDVSENLNQTISKLAATISDTPTNVIFSKDKEIALLSLRGRIFSSADRGKTWVLTAELPAEPPQIGFNRFGQTENKNFWIAGGTASIEGKWSIVAGKENSGWKKYRLNNYNLSDVKFLSNGEVIACGSEFMIDNSSGAAKESAKGIVVFSSNGGKDWEKVYESPTATALSQISVISPERILIAGETKTQIILSKN